MLMNDDPVMCLSITSAGQWAPCSCTKIHYDSKTRGKDSYENCDFWTNFRSAEVNFQPLCMQTNYELFYLFTQKATYQYRLQQKLFFRALESFVVRVCKYLKRSLFSKLLPQLMRSFL